MAEAVPRGEMEFLAAEYVIGLLDLGERAEAQRLIDTDATMRGLVADWEGRLDPLNAAYLAVPVPDIWRALDRELFAPSRRRRWLFWAAVAGLALALAAKLAFWVRLLG